MIYKILQISNFKLLNLKGAKKVSLIVLVKLNTICIDFVDL